MKTIMLIIGWSIIVPLAILETIVKIVWAIIYSIIRPFVKNSIHNYKMETYAYKWKGELWFCDWLINLWS